MMMMFVGSYSSANEEGIHSIQLNPESGALHRVDGVKGVEMPSFLALHPANGCMYAVSETKSGHVAALRVHSGNGSIELINQQPSHGDHPCHLTIDSEGRWLLLVNYSSGSICTYPISEDGAIGSLAYQVQHEGRSVRDDRQESPHPHSIFQITGTSLYLVPDLGTDKVFTYSLDRTTGALQLKHTTPSSSRGAGPRHLTFHPSKPFVYVIEELSSSVTAYKLDAAEGSLSMIQSISTLPTNYTGASTCAEVVVSPNGDYVYGSNRGHDSIAAFRITESGQLIAVGHTPSGGATPRNFNLTPDGAYLLAANQDSDNITVFKIDSSGLPVATGTSLDLDRPVCLRFARSRL